MTTPTTARLRALAPLAVALALVLGLAPAEARRASQPAAREVERARPALAPVPFDVQVGRYRRHVELFVGRHVTTVTNANGQRRRVRFTDRYVASPRHQLAEAANWLEAHYRARGFAVERQPIRYEGQVLENVIVTFPGDSKEAVLLCDHYDTADKEQIRKYTLPQLTRDYGLTRRQIARHLGKLELGQAVPGADDNASATAALLEMGELLSACRTNGVRLKKTVKLVHLVGEEMPADCLGARAYVKRAVARREKIAGVFVMDMIGVDREGRKKLQLCPGRSAASRELAGRIERKVGELGLDLRPVVRTYGAQTSYLDQTDGIIFSKAGIPVVLLNEHVNYRHDRFRVGYHDEFDIPELMSFDYAANVTRAALSAALDLAGPYRPAASARRRLRQ